MPVTSLAEPKVSKHNNKLMHTKTLSLSGIFFALCFSAGLETGVAASLPKPVSLQCDSLVEPLGIDNQKPLLSWQLQDARWGAVQTAYQIQIASKPDLLASGKADVWDSGRVLSGQSVNVPYGGGPLAPQKRYYWLVKAWDMKGHLYPPSDVGWWETGLLAESNWTAKWIGYEQEEHRHIRESGAAWITNSEV